ncbi:MAG: S8 family serine peptidase [Bacteroidota bacterium]
MMMRQVLTLVFSCVAVLLMGQGAKPAKYWVSFKDKIGTPYSTDQPEAFLSPRALERRFRHGIEVTEEDLPVNPAYVRKLTEQGAKLHNVSKWLNAAAVLADSMVVDKLMGLPFVDSVEYVGPHIRQRVRTRTKNKKRDQWEDYKRLPSYYGYGAPQIQMLSGDLLHDKGHRGRHMLVAVLDGGFTNVDIMPFFDSLRQDERLLQGRDFVGVDKHVWESSSHGSHVLSVMGSNLPGLLVGTAPDASYVCIKTEDTGGEYLIEECNWVAGAEYADSIGADVVNSSLGYTTFNDKSMNYTFEDLNGRKSRATQAANIAFSKGMIMVNSAGNSGRGPWKYIGVPSDAEKVLTVGATDFTGRRASFSSFGPSSDGRVKPDVATAGQAVTVASIYSYDVQLSNGTSFSSPMMAGMVASLWSAFPNKTNEDIVAAIRKCGNQATRPDDELGYGIPDFFKAYLYLELGQLTTEVLRTNRLQLYPVYRGEDSQLYLHLASEGKFSYTITDLAGKQLVHRTFEGQKGDILTEGLPDLPAGSYLMTVFDGEQLAHQLLHVPEKEEGMIIP